MNFFLHFLFMLCLIQIMQSEAGDPSATAANATTVKTTTAHATTVKTTTANATGENITEKDKQKDSRAMINMDYIQGLTPQTYMRRRRPTILDGKTKATVRPELKGLYCRKDIPPPTNVSISIYLSGVNSVSDGQISVSLFLKYSWEDQRLSGVKRNDKSDFIEVSASSKDYIWIPDLYMPTALQIVNPVLFAPPLTFKLFRNNTVLAHQFVHMKLRCPFQLSFFPMDYQVCRIPIQSFGSGPCSVTLSWARHVPVAYSVTDLAQFSYKISWIHGSQSQEEMDSPMGKRSQIEWHIILERKIMFYLLQIYIPSGLFVVVAWISFLIPNEMAQGRMLLTITTMLTMVSLFSANSEYVPISTYIKAIDYWVCLCTFMSAHAVFACLIDVKMYDRRKHEDEEEDKTLANTYVLTRQARRMTVREIFKSQAKRKRAKRLPIPVSESSSAMENMDMVDEDEIIALGKIKPDTGYNIKEMFQTVVEKIRSSEKIAVTIYPVIFITFNVIYWVVCIASMKPPQVGEMGMQMKKT